MSKDTLLDEGRQVFLEEARDLLRQMEAALLRLESEAGNAEAVHELFRAAHTIKGSAGLFGYDDIVSFTHGVESLLDQLRGMHLALTPELLSALLESCDHIGVLVERLVDGEPRQDAQAVGRMGAELAARLHAFMPQGAVEAIAHAPQSPEVEHCEARTGSQSDAWHISLRFGPDVLRNGMDPLSFIRYLATLGEIAGIVPIADALPAGSDYDPESCYLGFEIRLRSAADKSAIEGVFEFVRDDCTLHILPPHSRVQAYVDLIAALPESKERLGEILVECGALTARELENALAAQSGPHTGAKLGEILVDACSVQREVVDAALDKQRTIKAQRQQEARFLRVNADKLDRLITLVGEMVIATAGANLLAQRSTDPALREMTSQLSTLTEEIRDGALRLRMVQIGETFNRFHRVVRDVSCELGKDIALEVSGADTELDKSVVERIGDPLTHLVRNAMDHGIESAQERAAAGKPPRARIALNACHDSGSIVIEVSDDGRGLDRDRILAKARARGLVADDQVLSDAAIHALIFEPGFSTAESVSNLSGRGVGMDVVRQNIESLRGTVSLASAPGQGTTVTLRLPLTLAIIDGFLVQVGAAVYVLPLDVVVECVELPLERPSDGEYFSLRGQVLPYLRLRDMFEIDAPTATRESVVVVHNAGRKAGIVVDRLLGEAQTVIKPLGRLFGQVRGIMGSSILGTGEVALILDVPALLGRDVAGGQGGRGRRLAAGVH